MSTRGLSAQETGWRGWLPWLISRGLDRGPAGAAARLLLAVIPFGLTWFVLTLLVDPDVYPPPYWITSLPFPFDLVGNVLASLLAPRILVHLLPLVGALWLGMRLSAHYVNDAYGLDSMRMASRYLRSAVFGLGYDTLVVSSGDARHLDWTSTLLRIGGPGWLSVHLGFAAVFETVEGYPRVYGPSTRLFIRGFERLRDVIDLRDQLRRVEESRAVTRDGVEVLARDAQMVFRVHSGHQPRQLSDPYPYAEEAIRRLVYAQPVAATGQRKWSDALPGLVRREITRFIGELTLDEFLALQPGTDRAASAIHIPQQALTERFQTDTLRKRLQEAGLELDWVGVGTWEVLGAGKVQGEDLIAAWQVMRQARRDRRQEAPPPNEDALHRLLLDMVETWRDPASSGTERTRRLLALMAQALEDRPWAQAAAGAPLPRELAAVRSHLAVLLGTEAANTP